MGMSTNSIVTTARPADQPVGKAAKFSVDKPPLPTDIADGASNGVGLLRAAKLTVPQAARALAIGETKMREIIRTGSVPVIRVMGKTVLLERDLEEYLRSGYGLLRKAAAPSNRSDALPKAVRKSKYLN